ncbi:MAG: hypothetical protein DDT27_00785 [Dehalococcoidia bacterium]|nr:hypothetical protein [Chloroflexota bacterium]
MRDNQGLSLHDPVIIEGYIDVDGARGVRKAGKPAKLPLDVLDITEQFKGAKLSRPATDHIEKPGLFQVTQRLRFIDGGDLLDHHLLCQGFKSPCQIPFSISQVRSEAEVNGVHCPIVAYTIRAMLD